MSNPNHPNNHKLSRRNFALGIVNGSLVQFAGSLVDPHTVLAVFVIDLMGPKYAVIWLGVLVSLISAGWFWPGALLASRMETLQRRLPYYRLSAALRIVIRFALWGAVAYIGGSNALLLFVLVAVLLLIFTSAGGIGIIPFMSVVTDSIPPTWRGKFFATRTLLGNLLAFTAGLYVRKLLAAEGNVLWDNYATLFLLSAVITTFGLSAWCLAKEPRHTVQHHRLPFRLQFLRGPRLYRRDANFRRLIRLRILNAITASFAFPFVMPYVLANDLAVKAAAGMFLAAMVLGRSAANILWGYISDRLGNRLLLLITSIIGALLPPLVLLSKFIPPFPFAWAGNLVPDLTTAYLFLIFMLIGATQSGQNVGQTNYLLEVAPQVKRATYLGFFYTVLVPASFAPFIGSLIIGTGGRYELGFAVAAFMGIAGLLNTIRMQEVRWENGHSQAHPSNDDVSSGSTAAH